MFEVNSPGNDPERARAPRQEGGGRHVAEAGDQSGILTGGGGVGVGMRYQQTLSGSFSPVPKPIFASKY